MKPESKDPGAVRVTTALNPTITLEMVRDDEDFCYSAERLAELYEVPVPLRDVMTRNDGPWAAMTPDDRVRTACRALPMMARVLLGVTWADRAASRVPEIDPRVTACNATIWEWLRGTATDEQVDAASAAAWAAWAAA